MMSTSGVGRIDIERVLEDLLGARDVDRSLIG